MTKYTMIKKFRRETGCDKKTATEYLRNANWNYGKAIALFELPKSMQKICDIVKNIYFSVIVQRVADAIQTICENITELMNRIATDEVIAAIGEVLKEGDKNG